MSRAGFPAAPSPTPSTLVWSPTGQHKVKTYKPVSFNAQSSSSSNRTTPVSFQAGQQRTTAPSFGHSQSQDDSRRHLAGYTSKPSVPSDSFKQQQSSGFSTTQFYGSSPVTIKEDRINKQPGFTHSFTGAEKPSWQTNNSPKGNVVPLKSPKQSALSKQFAESVASQEKALNGVVGASSETFVAKKRPPWPSNQQDTKSDLQEPGWKPTLKSNAAVFVSQNKEDFLPKKHENKGRAPLHIDTSMSYTSGFNGTAGDTPSPRHNTRAGVWSSQSSFDKQAQQSSPGWSPRSPLKSTRAAGDVRIEHVGSSWNSSSSGKEDTRIRLPQTTSATVTLLQKNREKRKQRDLTSSQPSENGHQGVSSLSSMKPIMNHVPPQSTDNYSFNAEIVHVKEDSVPEGAVLVGTKETIDGDQKHIDSFYVIPTQEKSETKVVKEIKSPRYQGIGPVDDQTGMPVGFRKHVDEHSQKDWYKQMYKSLHKTDKQKEEQNPYKPTYSFPQSDTEIDEASRRLSFDSPQVKPDLRSGGSIHPAPQRSPDLRSGGSTHPAPQRSPSSPWGQADASYREEKYKNQPRSIADYEPGRSSIAIQEARRKNLYNPPVDKPGQLAKYVDSHTDVDIRRKERSITPASDGNPHDFYRTFLKGGDLPLSGLQFPQPHKKEPSSRHTLSSSLSPPVRAPANVDRRSREEEKAVRKEQLQRYTEEQKFKRLEKDIQDTEARRHHDYFLQKSPVPLDRFEDFDAAAKQIQRPEKKVNTQLHGKAKALYTFRPQHKRELAFRKGDIIYIIGRIDKNWFEGEKHGIRGIFPCNYVEVLTSLEEAKATALQRQGEARAKFTFVAQTPQELGLKKGDIVELIRRVDDNWYEGRCGFRQGIFPVSYVETEKEPDTPLLTPLPSLAPTPIPGSPGPVSPGSSISNGPAPSIPSAPLSPKDGLDSFDFNQPFDYGLQQFTRGAQAYSTLPRRMGNGPANTVGHSAGLLHGVSPSRKELQPMSSSLYQSHQANNPPSLLTNSARNPPKTNLTFSSAASSTLGPTARSSTLGSAARSSSSGYESDSALGPADGRMSVPLFRSTSGGGRTARADSSWTGTLPAQKTSTLQPAAKRYNGLEHALQQQRSNTLNRSLGLVQRQLPQEQRSPRSGGIVRTEYTGPVQDTGLQELPEMIVRPASAMAVTTPSSYNRPEKARVRFDTTATDKSDRRMAASMERSTNKYKLYRAMYTYFPQNPDELELRPGDAVTVMEKCDDGWYVGTSERTGEFGTFPGNYVQQL